MFRSVIPRYLLLIRPACEAILIRPSSRRSSLAFDFPSGNFDIPKFRFAGAREGR